VNDLSVKMGFHYTSCGLPNIWLSSGYEIEWIDGEEAVTIHDLDGLHATIGRALVIRKKVLDGPEVRFLRLQMNLTQAELARLIGCDVQQIARYEKGQNKIPGPADRLLRVLYREHLHDRDSLMDVLRAMERLDSRMDDAQVFAETSEGWRTAA